MSREIIDREIALWVQKCPDYEKFFAEPFVQALIQLCEIAVLDEPSAENLIKDFIKGLAIFPNEKRSVECERLMKPVMDMVKKWVQSDEYRKFLIDQEISGEAKLKVADVEMPISTKEILLHIIRTKENPLVPGDIAPIEKSLIEYKRKQYSTEDIKGAHDITKKNETRCNDSITPLLSDNISKDYDSMLANIKEKENQFWKGIPMDAVVNHFIILTVRKSKNGKTFLTPEQLISFLRRGFLNDADQPKQKINCAISEKGFVIKRFYEFFDLAVGQYSHPNRKENFIKLFTTCFNNWDERTVKHFFFKNKTKEQW